jgi:hypothetical protein
MDLHRNGGGTQTGRDECESRERSLTDAPDGEQYRILIVYINGFLL